ncbi:MAG TPA: alpha/beta hydrolase [Kiloniellales bacterium]|jgi:arylformamidase
MPQGLYRGMDRAELDRQLNLRARWPEHALYFDRWAKESAAVRARIGGRLDLAYGDTGGQTLDLFLPKNGSSVGPEGVSVRPPVLVFIHGGYWQSLDKGDFSYLAPPFLEAGIAFASVNYDLAPKIGIADIVAQIRRAILWLADTGANHGLDVDRLYVAGHSAGGHLAAMALLTEWAAIANGRPRPVKGACAISGVYELEPLRRSYHQDILRIDPATEATMSPARLLPKESGPLILAVGGEETAEFLLQQAELAAAWTDHGLPVRVVDLPGRNHFSAADALGMAGHPLFTAVKDMVDGG